VNAGDLAERVRSRFDDVVVARDEVTVVVEGGRLLDAVAFLRDDPELAFDVLSSVTATHWPDRAPAYWVSSELLSARYLHRIRVKVGVAEGDPRVPSLTPLYPAADWHEREVFDFYGVIFDGHPELTRILLPDDWEGYPLRKTEELGGVNTRYKGAFIPPVDKRL
jgi:NADH-quinone oxidoreductase subunit C